MEKILILVIRLVILCIKSSLLYLLWNYLLIDLIDCFSVMSYWQSLSTLFLICCLKTKVNIKYGESKSSDLV